MILTGPSVQVICLQAITWWGYEDQKLFSYAKETLEELGSSDEPFNFTMLTVDTHMTGGYTCELCGDEFENSYSNVYACSDRQVTEFIEWIQQQDFYENTTVILMGDHPTMDATYCRNIDNDYVRRVYTCVMNAPVSPVRNAYRSYSPLFYQLSELRYREEDLDWEPAFIPTRELLRRNWDIRQFQARYPDFQHSLRDLAILFPQMHLVIRYSTMRTEVSP